MTKRARKPVNERKLCKRGKKFIENKLKKEDQEGDKGAYERWLLEWFKQKDTS